MSGRRALGAVAALLLLAGCGKEPAGDPALFRSYTTDEPQSVDPAFAVDQTSGTLVSLIYPGLFRFDVDRVLAESH